MQEDLKLTYSCVLPRGKEKIVRVTFEGENCYAEGIIPDGKIVKQQGFNEEELMKLELYLSINKVEIFKKAKEITGIRHWLK